VPLPATTLAASSGQAGFDLLLIAHVACAVVGFGALATSGVQAGRLAAAGSAAPPTLRRYFAPGVNWAGRIVYGVPIFGFALVADSNGHLRLADAWVVAGLALWGLAAVAAETVLWPAERRVQATLAGASEGAVGLPDSLRRDCRLVQSVGGALALVFVAATVLMVAQPR
jgi:uncharacterized membrane protein